MERLTARDKDGNVVQLTVSSTGRAFHSDEIWQRLAAYEETGLTPGDIQRVSMGRQKSRRHGRGLKGCV